MPELASFARNNTNEIFRLQASQQWAIKSLEAGSIILQSGVIIKPPLHVLLFPILKRLVVCRHLQILWLYGKSGWREKEKVKCEWKPVLNKWQNTWGGKGKQTGKKNNAFYN